MARRNKIITIETGRDAGKRFEITEPSAFDGERLYLQLMSMLGSVGSITLSDMMSKISTPEGMFLWGELLSFVKIIPSSDGNIKRAIDKFDIEDLTTLIELRMGALGLLMDFTQE